MPNCTKVTVSGRDQGTAASTRLVSTSLAVLSSAHHTTSHTIVNEVDMGWFV
jgi:hypothetical protein